MDSSPIYKFKCILNEELLIVEQVLMPANKITQILCKKTHFS